MKKQANRKASPVRVNPFLHQADFDALYYSCQGNKTARYIAALTGLTQGQVTYRRLKEGIRVTQIRNGVPNDATSTDLQRAVAKFGHSLDRMGRVVFEKTVLRRLAKEYATPPMPNTNPDKKA